MLFDTIRNCVNYFLNVQRGVEVPSGLLSIHNNTNRLKETILVLIISFIVCISLFVYAKHILLEDYVKTLKQYETDQLDLITDIGKEIYNTLDHLNALDKNNCTEKLLKEMRRLVFGSSYIKDIGYLKGNVLYCTTGVGKLKRPYTSSLPDITRKNGVQLWLNHTVALSNRNHDFHIIQRGNYNAVISNKQTLLNERLSVNWEIAIHDKNRIFHIQGKRGLYETVTKQNNLLPENAIPVTTCDKNLSYCVVILGSYSHFYELNRTALIGWLLCLVIIFILCFITLSHYINSRKSLTSRIRKGVKNKHFYCLYQPIFSLESNKIIGCEVLARYKDAKGEIYPNRFVPIVSQQKQSWDFTLLIYKLALTRLSKFTQLPADFKVNINFFAQDISNGNCLSLIEPNQFNKNLKITLEVTEDEALNQNSAIETLTKMIAAGFEVAIDDFGTGFSNLQQLQKLPFHSLKIDRSFVHDMEDGAVRSTLIPHIIAIAKKLNVKIVAEGIENSVQYQALRELEVDFGQGYLMGKPMSGEALQTLLVNQSEESDC